MQAKTKGPCFAGPFQKAGAEAGSILLSSILSPGRAPFRRLVNNLTRTIILNYMIPSVNSNEEVAAFRLLELLNERTPWNRSLWGIGVVLALDEFYEACTARRQGHLSDAAVNGLASALQKRVGRHPGFTNPEKQFLQAQLKSIPRPDGAAHYCVRELTNRVSADYLHRWGRAVATQQFTVELFGRNVAAYLLDAGFSPQHMHHFVKNLIKAPEPITLSELCDALQTEMSENPQREFEAMVALKNIPKLPNGVPRNWLQGPAVIGWLRDNNFDPSGIRSPVAIILRVQARDVYGAAQATWDEIDRYSARAHIATGKPLEAISSLWIKGATEPAPMKMASRGVGVKELFREDRIFSSDVSDSVEAALELLSHLEGSSAPAAVAGGWAAIEGLLADPNDRSSAAENLATLVACSFPRAELTPLSYQAEVEHPEACAELVGAESNRDRCRILAELIANNRLPVLESFNDRAAVSRLSKLLANPGPELLTIRDGIAESLQRLYRQRNLILHGARLDSVALTASLRTVAKLVGAGMDRITHGHYVQGLKPLELVARAKLGLALVDQDAPEECVNLLERG